MIRNISTFFFAALFIFTSPCRADERSDAIAASKNIMNLMVTAKYKTLWDLHTSDFFKKSMTEGAFLSNMTLGRSAFGPATGTAIVDIAFSTNDPASGYTGKIYAVTFKNDYSMGSFYERVVVTLESDSVFRMSGIWGTPIPR